MPRDPFRVTPQELQEYRRLFDLYDVNHTGFLEASVAAEYLTQSRLPQPILHNILLSCNILQGKQITAHGRCQAYLAHSLQSLGFPLLSC